MKTQFALLLSLIVVLLMFSSCDQDDPEIPNEEELITTINYTLTNVNDSSDEHVLIFTDSDGDGGQEPEISGATLKANSMYNGSITLSNQSTNPPQDITTEIESESLEHQFFYSITPNDASIQYNDMDSDGNPIGLITILSTGNEGSGNVIIILRHEPNKTADGVREGDISNAGGETDIEVTLPINVE